MKEDILFAMLKDKPVLKRKEFEKKYPNVNVSDLRLRIINYQVMRYGIQLSKDVEFVDDYDRNRASNNAKSRKKYWRNKEIR